MSDTEEAPNAVTQSDFLAAEATTTETTSSEDHTLSTEGQSSSIAAPADEEEEEEDVEEDDFKGDEEESDDEDTRQQQDPGTDDEEEEETNKGGKQRRVNLNKRGRGEKEDGEVPRKKQADYNSPYALIPSALGSSLLACKRCGLLQSFPQFFDNGCPNCPFLQMIEDNKRVQSCTTPFHAGTYAMIEPNESWMGKWLRLNGGKGGVYAISVKGEWDENIQEILTEGTVRWRCKP